jgi:very-short-patch-repair endonuclease
MECSGKKKYTQEEARKIYFDNEYIMIDKYINSATPVKCRCSCGCETYISLTNCRQTNGCNNCGGRKTFTQEEAREKFLSHKFIMLGEYINNKTPVKCLCSCECETYVSLNNVLNGSILGCKICKNKTQKMVSDFLKQIYEDVIDEKQFDFSGRKSYDIYIKQKNIIIEIDGSQHFLNPPNKHNLQYKNTPEENLENDSMKQNLLFDKGIKLIRIYQPYILKCKNDEWKTLLLDAIESKDTFICISPEYPNLYDDHKNIFEPNKNEEIVTYSDIKVVPSPESNCIKSIHVFKTRPK